MHPHRARAARHSHLDQDLDALLRQSQRRRALRSLAGGAIAGGLPWLLQACGGGDDATSTTGSGGTGSTTSTGTASTGTASCSSLPAETAGPYPGDGTNSNAGGVVNALTLTGIVRSDIRSSVGGASGTAGGVPLTVALKLVNTALACAALSGYAVYLWHCTREGAYSLYSSGVTGENFLRGVQVSDANGELRFTTIFPGCYAGRWPHIHFEIFTTLAAATSGSNDVLTSQLALPAAECSQVYSSASGYGTSATNFASISLASDNVFGNDGAAQQLAAVTGDVTNGFTATLTIGL